jgi:hypothetical protein
MAHSGITVYNSGLEVIRDWNNPVQSVPVLQNFVSPLSMDHENTVKYANDH